MSVIDGRIGTVRVAVVPGSGGSGITCALRPDGSAAERPGFSADLISALRERERQGATRWVWADTAAVYPALLAAGWRADRCHDVRLTEALLRARDGAAGERASALAARAARSRSAAAGSGGQQPLFDDAAFWPSGGQGTAGGSAAAWRAAGAASGADPAAAIAAELIAVADELIAAHAEQLGRIAGDARPGEFGKLVAAESGGGLIAAEMTYAGLPWDSEIHDRLLAEAFGPRPAAPGIRPARLAELAAGITAALGAPKPVNPDSPAQLLRALGAAGILVSSTRTSALRGIDHPAIPPLLEYKELARLHSAFGWSWMSTWVRSGRFHPEYVVGGVVSGRWASSGGGALQIPRVLRRAVVADPGWVLVVADAAQLEPRVLAALSGDRALARAAASGDLYSALAGAFGGERAKAKVALLSALYGGSGGEGGQLLAVLRQRFPAAYGYVEAAARAGQEGQVVRSVLGRACPPPSADWLALTTAAGAPESGPDPAAGRASRARGRFTRNFVVQASAADWALVLLARLRSALAGLTDLTGQAGHPGHPDQPGHPGRPGWTSGPHLVFFQHDEVIVHCPAGHAPLVVAAIEAAGREATRLVFGGTGVTFPLAAKVADRYSDAK